MQYGYLEDHDSWTSEAWVWTQGIETISTDAISRGGGQKALEEGGVEADPVTFVGLLNACASAATLERRQVS